MAKLVRHKWNNIFFTSILVLEMKAAIENLLRQRGISVDTDALLGFHYPPFITVDHLHLHGIAPVKGMSYIGKYCPNGWWFKRVCYIVCILMTFTAGFD
jgi:hypothetical protein